jgi:hypothetical protein
MSSVVDQESTKTKTYGSTVYANGKKWFYRLKGEDGLIENLTDEERALHLIISFINPEQRRFYTTFETHSEFIQYMIKLPQEKRCFHEVVLDRRPQKMRFDLDIKRYKYFEEKVIEEVSENDVQVFFDQLIESILLEFYEIGFKINPKDHLLVFSSHGKEKWSYHIIIDGFYCETHQDAAELFKRITSRMSRDHLDWLDGSIYSINHCLRTLGSVKEDGRIKILDKKWKFKNEEIIFEYPEPPRHENHRFALEFERSFLTLNSNCFPLPSFVQKQALDGINNKQVEKQAEEDVIHYASLLFKSLYGDICVPTGSMNNMILLTRKYPSGCPLCERVHENENAFLWLKPIETTGITKYEIYFHCRRAIGQKMKIGEKILVDEKQIKDSNGQQKKVIVEKVSRGGFSLKDLEDISRTSIGSLRDHKFK